MAQALTVNILEAVVAAAAVCDRGGPSSLQGQMPRPTPATCWPNWRQRLRATTGGDGGGEEEALADEVEAGSVKAAGTAGTIAAGPKGSAVVCPGGSGGVAQEPSRPATLQGLQLKVSAVQQLLLALCLPLSWLLQGASHLEAQQTGYSTTMPASAAASASGAAPPPTGGPAPPSGDGA